MAEVTNIEISKRDKVIELEMELDKIEPVDSADTIAIVQAQVSVEQTKILQEISNNLYNLWEQSLNLK